MEQVFRAPRDFNLAVDHAKAASVVLLHPSPAVVDGSTVHLERVLRSIDHRNAQVGPAFPWLADLSTAYPTVR